MIIYNQLLNDYSIRLEASNKKNHSSNTNKFYLLRNNPSDNPPFYKIINTKENKIYAVGLKDTAFQIKSKLEDLLENAANIFSKNYLFNSNETILSAEVIDDGMIELPELITIDVKNIATPQVNVGKELPNQGKSMEVGTYIIRACVKDENYNLSFHMKERVSNIEAQKMLVEFLNTSLPGVNAAMENTNREGYSRIVLKSEFTGVFQGRSFSLRDADIYKMGVVEYFGLNEITEYSTNAKFELNGIPKETLSNHFTIENTLEIELHGISDHTIEIRKIPDIKGILQRVFYIQKSVNDLMVLAESKLADSGHNYRASKLLKDLSSVFEEYQEKLEEVGINFTSEQRLEVKEKLVIQAVIDGTLSQVFSEKNGFITKLLHKMEAIVINPINYLDKILVTYPNNSVPALNKPYFTSMYSGFLFNYYC